jgi:hypothetical protein
LDGAQRQPVTGAGDIEELTIDVADVGQVGLVSSNLRAHVERFVQIRKPECLDKFVIVAERRLNYVNRERPYEADRHLPPALKKPPEAKETIRLNDVVNSTRMGGLLKHYQRQAA